MRWLRQAYKWSGIQTLAKADSRVKRGRYECKYCGDEIGLQEFEIDHENPCVEIYENKETGYDYNGIIERMFDPENSQVLCKPCHRKKTGRENAERKRKK